MIFITIIITAKIKPTNLQQPLNLPIFPPHTYKAYIHIQRVSTLSAGKAKKHTHTRNKHRPEDFHLGFCEISIKPWRGRRRQRLSNFGGVCFEKLLFRRHVKAVESFSIKNERLSLGGAPIKHIYRDGSHKSI